jgi:hypothetical protein
MMRRSCTVGIVVTFVLVNVGGGAQDSRPESVRVSDYNSEWPGSAPHPSSHGVSVSVSGWGHAVIVGTASTDGGRGSLSQMVRDEVLSQLERAYGTQGDDDAYPLTLRIAVGRTLPAGLLVESLYAVDSAAREFVIGADILWSDPRTFLTITDSVKELWVTPAIVSRFGASRETRSLRIGYNVRFGTATSMVDVNPPSRVVVAPVDSISDGLLAEVIVGKAGGAPRPRFGRPGTKTVAVSCEGGQWTAGDIGAELLRIEDTATPPIVWLQHSPVGVVGRVVAVEGDECEIDRRVSAEACRELSRRRPKWGCYVVKGALGAGMPCQCMGVDLRSRLVRVTAERDEGGCRALSEPGHQAQIGDIVLIEVQGE